MNPHPTGAQMSRRPARRHALPAGTAAGLLILLSIAPGAAALPRVAGEQPPSSLSFTPATVVDPVLFGGEPGFNFDNSSDGVSKERSFVDWPVSSRQSIGVLFRSEDGGLSYTKRYADTSDPAQGAEACDARQVPTCGGGGGGDTDVSVDAKNGNIIFGSQEALASQLIGTSNDHGDTFPLDHQDPVVGKDATAVDRQWSATYAGTDTVFLAYHIPLVGEYINRSDSRGATGSWSIPAGPQIPSVTQSGALVIDNSRPSPGFPNEHPIYVGYLNSGFKVGVSLDGSKTFTVHSVPSNASVRNFTKLALDRAGNLYATWVDSSTQRTMLSSSLASDPANVTAPATKWSTPVPIGAPGLTVTIFSDAVAGDPGRLAISYYGTTANASTPDTVKPGAGGWLPYVGVSTNALCQWEGSPCAAPTFDTAPIAHQINQDDNICTSGTACAATGGNRNLLDYFDISLDSAGHLGFVWSDTTNDTLLPFVKVARQSSGPSLYADQPDASAPQRVNGEPDANGDARYPIAGVKIRSAKNQPKLDLAGTTVTVAGSSLHIVMKLTDATALGSAVPGGGTGRDGSTVLQQAKYLTRWDFGGKSYYAGANVAAGTDAPTFFSGTVNNTEGVMAAGATAPYGNTYAAQGPATGSVKDGAIVLDVPLTAVGSPVQDSRLISVGSYTLLGATDRAVTLNTLPITVDSTPTFDTTLALAPTPEVPEAPMAVLLPLTAVVLALGLFMIRRRTA